VIKDKRSASYIALLTRNRNSALYNHWSGSWFARDNGVAAQMWPSAARDNGHRTCGSS